MAGAVSDLEEGTSFEPRFGADGLAICVAIDAARGEVLMVAHMNREALEATLKTGIVHYWSRSRGRLWRKGDTSGQTQKLIEMRVDCDQDAFLALVEVGATGAPATPAAVPVSTAGSRRTRPGSVLRLSNRRRRSAYAGDGF